VLRGRLMRVVPRENESINEIWIADRDRFSYEGVYSPDRLTTPLVRRDGELVPSSWEDALAEVARRLAEIHKVSGPDSIGFIGSNRTTNEEDYLLQRFARTVLGTNHVDHHRTADYTGLAAALGPRAADSLATMADVYASNSTLLVANDPTQQNPLVAWQIRTAIRHRKARLYVINGRPSKIHRKASYLAETPKGAERQAVRFLATGEGQFDENTRAALAVLKAGLEKESDVVIIFGADIQGAALRDLVNFGSKLSGHTRFMALGDYANSRGAADMGILPDRLPGYAPLSDAPERARFGKLWGGEIPSAPGLTARAMMDAAAGGKIKALYVVGANPVKTFNVKQPDRLAALELLVVQDMFLTETAARADVVLPAASTYEKDGTLTNTAGQVQMTHRSIDPQGPRSDFDLIRILSHQLSMLGVGTPIRLRTPEAAFDEIRQNVPGYDLSVASLLGGGAENSTASCKTVEPSYETPADIVFSSEDFLFTSGTLGRYCSKLKSTNEAKDIPWSSSPSIQSWWYR
jgi:NADH-quinone oxidoreductase subunit G